MTFHVGARLPHKRWSMRNWVDLARRVQREWGHRVEFVLGPTEATPRELGETPFAVARTRTLGELREKILRSRFVVGLDSLAAHIAAVHGTPVVALFGRMPSSWFAPLGNEAWVVGGQPERSYPARTREECLAPGYMLSDVTVEEAWRKVEALECSLAGARRG